MKEETVYSPITGTAVLMQEVPDPVFTENILGVGLAIWPTESKVVAPFDGIVSEVTGTNHAICLTSDAGLELLIHLGINTVKLKGQGFQRYVKKGQRIKRGDPLIEFDFSLCDGKILHAISPCLVANGERFSVHFTHLGAVCAGETPILHCGTA
jgi:glucose-specific phosphotransferase system IIA component